MRTWVLVCVFFAGQSSAYAGLGGDDVSIQREMKKMGVERTVAQHNGYALHELTQKKLVLHEFMGDNGKVFAVAWSGRTHPDMALILGDHYKNFQDALAQVKRGAHGRHGHGAISVEVGGVHVDVGGHLMSVSGRVWLTDQLPPGLDTHEIR